MNPYKTYQRTNIQTADRVQVIVLLYEGALRNLNRVIAHLENRAEEKEWSRLVSKTLDIVQFLSNALNHQEGGNIATNLSSLYDFIRDTITMGNIKSDPEQFKLACRLLNELLEGWREVSNTHTTPYEGETPVESVPQTAAHVTPAPSTPTGYGPTVRERKATAITA